MLALGHSARDTFELLEREGFALEQKPFAVGVRIEHPQEMINRAQYGAAAENLPAADYRLTYTTKAGRGTILTLGKILKQKRGEVFIPFVCARAEWLLRQLRRNAGLRSTA